MARHWSESMGNGKPHGSAFQSVGRVQHSSFIDIYISTFLNSFSGCQNSARVGYEIPSFNMDPKLASRPANTGFEGYRQINGYGQLVYDDLAPVSFFSGNENRLLAELYMHHRLDICVVLSLDNDDEIVIIHFAGTIYSPILPSSGNFLRNHKMSSYRKRPRQSIEKKEPASCLRQIKRARKWKPWVREKLERGRRRCSVDVLELANGTLQQVVLCLCFIIVPWETL